ncbi:MAG: hypothetical protein ABJA02_07705 [Acidobacteriota bacterium]
MGRELEKRQNHSVVGENAQYGLGLGVVGVMLYIIGLPAFVIFFLGVFSFFLWKLFAAGAASDTRKIFEFYLIANEILREDDRRWYGFEVHDAIQRGERIIRAMPSAPPLLHFAVGALYQKIGDDASAEKHLAAVVVDGSISEAAIVFPSNELRDYVKVLRKIERDPAEAPQTSSAVRSLERFRKNKGQLLLEQVRTRLSEGAQNAHGELTENGDNMYVSFKEDSEPGQKPASIRQSQSEGTPASSGYRQTSGQAERQFGTGNESGFSGRKPISEVLQDIYDDKVQ